MDKITNHIQSLSNQEFRMAKYHLVHEVLKKQLKKNQEEITKLQKEITKLQELDASSDEKSQ